MEKGRGCPLFRRPESLSFGKGIGYCEMDGSREITKDEIDLDAY